jgi:hypothetical protein
MLAVPRLSILPIITRLRVWANGFMRRPPLAWSIRAFAIQQVNASDCSTLTWRPMSSKEGTSTITGTERAWIFFESRRRVGFIASYDGCAASLLAYLELTPPKDATSE